MQTFLPYSNYKKVAECLDSKRLNKQIVEAYQLLTGKSGHKNHPASLMWQGYEFQLKEYLLVCAKEYTRRYNKIHKCTLNLPKFEYCEMPEFVCNPIVLISHRIRLLVKDFGFYDSIFTIPKVFVQKCPEGYYWPLCIGKTAKLASENWTEFYNENKIEIYKFLDI